MDILHDKKSCIGCGLCVESSPNFWKMNNVENKAELIGSKEKNGLFVLTIKEKDFEKNKQASENCPIGAIQLKDSSKTNL